MVMDARTNPLEVSVDDAVEATEVDIPSVEETKPSTEPEMLTREQAEKLANERHSTLDKRISELEKNRGTSAKALEAAVKKAQAAENALAVAQKQLEETERKALGETPDALSLFEAKVAHKRQAEALDERVRQFEQSKSEWDETVIEAKQYKTQKLADEIASNPKHKVDAALLVSMTDGTREAMEKLATVLPAKTEEDTVVIPHRPDSGARSRVLTNPTVEQLNSMSMEAYAAYVAERDKKKR